MSRAVSIRNQLRRYLERFGINVEESLTKQNGNEAINKGEQIRKCLTTGYFAHAARMQPDGTFKTVNGNMILNAHPSSLMFVSYLRYSERRAGLTVARIGKLIGSSFTRSWKPGIKLSFGMSPKLRRAGYLTARYLPTTKSKDNEAYFKALWKVLN